MIVGDFSRRGFLFASETNVQCVFIRFCRVRICEDVKGFFLEVASGRRQGHIIINLRCFNVADDSSQVRVIMLTRRRGCTLDARIEH